MANNQNLVSLATRTQQERIEIAKKGNKASTEAKRKKATMISVLEKMLDEVPIKDNEDGLTNRELATLGLIKGAVNGNVNNYRTILELVGELTENQSNEEEHKVIIEVVNNSNLESVMYDENNK